MPEQAKAPDSSQYWQGTVAPQQISLAHNDMREARLSAHVLCSGTVTAPHISSGDATQLWWAEGHHGLHGA